LGHNLLDELLDIVEVQLGTVHPLLIDTRDNTTTPMLRVDTKEACNLTKSLYSLGCAICSTAVLTGSQVLHTYKSRAELQAGPAVLLLAVIWST
jgi:hypothetical protein